MVNYSLNNPKNLPNQNIVFKPSKTLIAMLCLGDMTRRYHYTKR